MSLKVMTIKSKIFNYGNEHEASWPPQYPETTQGLVGYIDPITKEFKKGYPPNPNNNFGIAPSVIFDSMPPTYHEGACRTVESRQEWERLDKKHNCLTFGSIQEPRKYIDKGISEEKMALKKDRRRAAREALQKVRANPKEINEKLNREADKQRKTAGKIAENYKLHKELKDII